MNKFNFFIVLSNSNHLLDILMILLLCAVKSFYHYFHLTNQYLSLNVAGQRKSNSQNDAHQGMQLKQNGLSNFANTYFPKKMKKKQKTSIKDNMKGHFEPNKLHRMVQKINMSFMHQPFKSNCFSANYFYISTVIHKI